MPVPFMGPPVLVDLSAKIAISQTTAIILYLGERLRLLPTDVALRALTLKTVADANDVIDDITIDGGRQMWTRKSWRAFEPRLEKWMSLWEETGRRHGLQADAGFLLGGKKPGIADVVTAVLWGTPSARFPRIAEMLEKAAPRTAALSRRIGALPALAKLAAKSRRAYGEAYCGGQIEASLRKVLGG
jgi:glutathione S-transferase